MAIRQPAVGDVGLNGAYWAGRTVLVTGAAGLLGGWVVDRLAREGATTIGLDIAWSRTTLLGDRDDFRRVDGDVRDRETLDSLLRTEGIDTVFHLAAQALVGVANDDPVGTFEHNVLGTWATLDACRANPAVSSIVVASSDKAYGDHNGEPYVESMPLLARHPYAASKTCTDVIAQTYAETYRLPVAITRCGNMYGGGDTEWSRIVPGTIRSVLRDERPVIRSDGRYVRDYFYVEDAADGVLALAEAVAKREELGGEAFNFAAEEHADVIEIVTRILDLTASNLEPVVRNEAVHEIRDQRVSAEKAHNVLGWRAAHSLDDGLRSTIDWYRSHLREVE
jgi:CDP-glucose 4,6-dehydratase